MSDKSKGITDPRWTTDPPKGGRLRAIDTRRDGVRIDELRDVLVEFFESLLGQPEIDTYIEVAAGAALNRLRGVE